MPALGAIEDQGVRQTPKGGGWDDLPLRAQGMVVLAVPVVGLVAAAVLVVVKLGDRRAPAHGLSVTILAVLALSAVAGVTATWLFMRGLARRIDHLRTNAERLALDVELDPVGPGSDELAEAEATLARAADVLASHQSQLEEARASLEHLVSAGPMVMFAGVLTARPEDPAPLNLDYISSNSARVMGHSPVALLNQPSAFVGLLHPDDLPAVLTACRRAIGDSRRQLRVEFRIRHLDGSWRWMEGTVRGHGSEPCRVLGYAVDITARHDAEAAKRESESLLDAFLDHSSALISLKDPFGRYQFANRAFTHLLGDPEGEVAGTDDFDHWPDAAPQRRALDQQVLVSRHPVQFEEVIDLPDGRHTFLTVKFPLLGDDEVPVAVGSISTDITELTHAVASVAARERVLSTVIGASPDVITILESDGTIRTTSIAFERIFGYPTRSFVDRKLFDLVHPEDRAATAAEWAQLSDGEHARVTLRFRACTATGFTITIESHAQVITGPDGENDGVVMVSRDISDQIALEVALRSAKEEAERASNAKSEFLSRASHELRTPLNAMLGFAQLLELEGLDDPVPDYVGQISHAGEHLLALINEVLDIARIESDNVNLRLEPTNGADALGEVLDLTAPLAVRAGVELHRQIDDEVPDEETEHLLWADRQRLLQVLLNLVSNAIKYNHLGGRVELSVARRGGSIRMSVRDTGPGLGEEQIDRLFIPFDRLGREHSNVEGTGVGLALSRGLAERMGGTLSVSSRLGCGSVFHLDLPAVVRADQPRPTTSTPSATTPTPTDESTHPSLAGGPP